MIRSEEGLRPLVAKLKRLGTVTADDAAAIERLPHTVKTLRHGDFISKQGDEPAQCTLVLEGIASRDRVSSTGARQISGFYISGDLIDLNAVLVGCAHDNIQVFGSPTVARIPADAIAALIAERPAIARLLWIDTLVDASIAREWTLNLGRRDARMRLLHLICELALRQENAGLGSREEVTLPLTQEQVSDALGLTSVHVNRTIQSLRADTSLERDGRTIRIKNWQQLTRQADFDDAYLRTRRGLV